MIFLNDELFKKKFFDKKSIISDNANVYTLNIRAQPNTTSLSADSLGTCHCERLHYEYVEISETIHTVTTVAWQVANTTYYGTWPYEYHSHL